MPSQHSNLFPRLIGYAMDNSRIPNDRPNVCEDPTGRRVGRAGSRRAVEFAGQVADGVLCVFWS